MKILPKRLDLAYTDLTFSDEASLQIVTSLSDPVRKDIGQRDIPKRPNLNQHEKPVFI